MGWIGKGVETSSTTERMFYSREIPQLREYELFGLALLQTGRIESNAICIPVRSNFRAHC